MWYPLKNSLTALVLTAAALFALLHVSAPIESPAQTEARTRVALVDAASRLAARLPIEDTEARLAIAIALYSAGAIAEAVERDAGDRRRLAERRRVAMPYFSFGANPARTTEPGA